MLLAISVGTDNVVECTAVVPIIVREAGTVGRGHGVAVWRDCGGRQPERAARGDVRGCNAKELKCSGASFPCLDCLLIRTIYYAARIVYSCVFYLDSLPIRQSLVRGASAGRPPRFGALRVALAAAQAPVSPCCQRATHHAHASECVQQPFARHYHFQLNDSDSTAKIVARVPAPVAVVTAQLRGGVCVQR